MYVMLFQIQELTATPRECKTNNGHSKKENAHRVPGKAGARSALVEVEKGRRDYLTSEAANLRTKKKGKEKDQYGSSAGNYSRT